jgi:hypothetical protein
MPAVLTARSKRRTDVLHLPKNHPLRPLYRFLALAAGGYCLLFGIVGVARTHDAGVFDQSAMSALGLRTNLAFSILSIAVGAAVIAVVARGHNLDQTVLMVLGPGFMLVGLIMLAVLRTGANVLNFDLTTCIVSFIIGLVLFAAGMYSEVAPRRDQAAEEQYRHATVPRRNVPLEDTPQRDPELQP